jgi:hypothetical protein
MIAVKFDTPQGNIATDISFDLPQFHLSPNGDRQSSIISIGYENRL